MKKNLKKLSWFLVIVAGFMMAVVMAVSKDRAVVTGITGQNQEDSRNVAVRLDGAEIKAEIASTDEQMTKGLGGRSALPDGTGMLFVFKENGKWVFWMKDMKFSIDIIWFDENFRVVDWRSRVSPDSFPNAFTPKTLSRYVLELNADFVEKYGVKAGDKLEIL